MKSHPHGLTEQGVARAAMVAATDLGWYFLQHSANDVGLDGYFDVLADGVPSGRLLGVQLKAGSSYFTRPTEAGDGWVYYGGRRELRDYWLSYQLPVLLVLYDPDANTAYWQHITSETAQVIGKGFKVIVPSSQRLDASSKLALTAIADQAPVYSGTRPAAVVDDLTSVQGSMVRPEVRNEAVASAIHNLIQAGTIQGGVHIHGVGVRPGQPGFEARFQAAFDLAGGAARLGSPMGEVHQDGPGWVQPFDGGPTGQVAVLCALPRKAAVAVAAPVWDELCAVGEGAALGGTVGLGYPCPEQGPYIGVDRESVSLEGGRWGQGHLLRRPSGGPLWRPKVALDGEATQERDRWTGGSDKMDLRVRLATRIPLVADGLRITGPRRSRMYDALAGVGMIQMLGHLARRYGLEPEELVWREVDEPDGYNNSRFAMYQLVMRSATGEPVITAFLWLILPAGRAVDLFSGVDLRINFDGLLRHSASASAAPIPAEFRLNHRDLIDFYTQAWHVATMVLPLAAAEDVLEVPPAGAPRLELHVKNEHHLKACDMRPLATTELVDLSVFGENRRRQIDDLAAAATTPLGLDMGEIESLVKRALVMMAEDAGFRAADATML